MPKRLVDLYGREETVEILLRYSGNRWIAGRVVAHEFPGVWVETVDGNRWFVTNHRRIRRRNPRN